MDRGQTAAITESKFFYACDTIGNCQRGQTGAILETIFFNAYAYWC